MTVVDRARREQLEVTHDRPWVVVGIDGSVHARRALRAAVAEAVCRDAVVHAVTAWPLVLLWPGMQYGVGGPEERIDSIRYEYTEILEKELADLETDVEIVPVVTRGPAAAALLAEARGAELLVVGTRGQGGFKGLVLGSVSQQVTGHAECPVLVVP